MSAQKQCPKCGEKNPAEAVMCWACYTSLTGGVAAAGGITAPGVSPITADEGGEKKKIEPKQLAIIGVGLLVLLGVGAKTMLGGGEPEADELEITTGAPAKAPAPAPAATQPPVSTVVGPSGPAPSVPASVVTPQRFPYQMLGSPNPNASTATVAIVPTENDLTEGQARGLAAFAHRQITKAKKWPAVEIFVFNDVESAQSFANYQNRLRGAALTESDYTSSTLTALWPKTLVRYYSRNERVWITSPRTNIGSFWKSGTASR